MMHKAMYHQLRKKRLALDKLHSCLAGRVVKALDFRSDWGSACRIDSRNERLFYDDDGGAAQTSAKRKRRCAGMSAAIVGVSIHYTDSGTQE